MPTNSSANGGDVNDIDMQKWIVEQAVILKSRSTDSPWSLADQVIKVTEALQQAKKLIQGSSDAS